MFLKFCQHIRKCIRLLHLICVFKSRVSFSFAPISVKTISSGMCRSCSVSVTAGCCVKAGGYYCFYDLRDRAMECEDWAELCDLRKLLRQMKFSNFSIGSVRQAHFRALENLKVDAPFSETSRFPPSRVYVNISCSRYSDLFRQVSSALSYKERDREVDRRVGTHTADQDKPGSNLPQQDSSVSFYQAVESLIGELCKRVEVYDQVGFERKYQLKWCPSGHPPPDGPPDGGHDDPVDPPEWTWVQLREAIVDLSLDPDDYRYVSQFPSYLVCGKTPSVLPASGTVPTTPSARIVMFTMADYNRCSISSKMDVLVFDEFTGVVSKQKMSGGDSLRQRRAEASKSPLDSGFVKL